MQHVEKKEAVFRFYEELNDFLPDPDIKERPYKFWGRPTVKDAVEAQGIPHTEIEIIMINGISVGFDHHLKDGDRVAVYPVFESLDVSPLIRLRPKPLRSPRFAADRNLRKTARWMRLLGFDVWCARTETTSVLIEKCAQNRRIILSRDKNLLKQKTVTRGYYVRSNIMKTQIREILNRFDLWNQLKPFTRCMECNSMLLPVNKEACTGLLPDKAAQYFDRFQQCRGCGKIYWEGSHYHRMFEQIEMIRQAKNK